MFAKLNKKLCIAQNIAMALAYCLISFYMIAILLLLPLKINFKAHFNLDSQKLNAELKILSFSLVRLKITLNKGFGVFINGKRSKHKNSGFSAKNAVAVMQNIMQGVSSGFINAYFCADAKNLAIFTAIAQLSDLVQINAYQGEKTDKFCLDMHIKLKLSLLQIVHVTFCAKDGEKKYAKP